MDAIRLTKSEVDKIESLQERLDTSSQNFLETLEEFNDKIPTLAAPLKKAFDQYKDSVVKVGLFVDSTIERLTNSIASKAERSGEWEGSDEEQTSNEMLSSWTEFKESITEHLEPRISLPGEISPIETLNQFHALSNLPQDANE
jgi:predicted RNase H-like nuclease (RuvC/YqgF family)